MSSSGASVAYLILATFFGGFWLGVVAMVAVAVRKEDRRFSLSGAAPGAAARGTRWLTRFGGAGRDALVQEERGPNAGARNTTELVLGLSPQALAEYAT